MRRFDRLSTFSLVASLLSSAAYAQEDPAAAPDPAPQIEEEAGEQLFVTGSRIARQDYVSTSPLVTLGQETLESTPSVGVESVLNQLPQFVQGQNQSAIGAVAGGGRATLNLRGLGETRNLVLLNGRRLPLSNAFAVVDVNIIPPNIIENVETITGGASAVYGSDAISGVVNFRTRRAFEGVELDARIGSSFHGDAGTRSFGVLVGTGTRDDRARAVLSLSYNDREVLWGSDREEFFALGVLSSFIAQGTYVPSATNLPDQSVVNAVFAQYGIAPGAVPNSRSLGFNDNGTLFSQIGASNYRGPTTGLFSTFGGIVRQPVTMQEYIVQPLHRLNLYGSAEYDLTDSITAYVQALHTDYQVTGQVGWTPTLFVAPITIPVTNPFIPADLRTILASRPDPTAPFTLNQRFVGFEDRKFISDVNVTQYVFGIRGELGVSDWTWDIYGLHDSMDLVETQDAALLLSRLQPLLNAPDGGASLCAGGYNPFGLAASTSVSPACRDYVETETHDFTETSQDVLEANLTGGLFALPGGDVRFAVTGTYRRNRYEYDPDPIRENGDLIGTLASVPTQGRINVKELGVELLLPILRDMPFAHTLEVNLGYRISDYNITGTVNTYRAEGLWRPIRALLIRGGYERATRAPNIGELFSTSQTGQVQFGSPPSGGDPCDVRSAARTGANAGQVRTLCLATGVPAPIIDLFQYTTVAIASATSGSTALEPETADTITAGLVLSAPTGNPWLSGLSLSADFYDIRIRDVISQVSAVTTLNKCYNLDGTNPSYDPDNAFCQLISRDATGGISVVSTPYLNLGGLRTRGVDIQADWRLNLEETIGVPGRLHLNAVVNFLDSYRVQILPGAAFVEYAGTIDGTQAATTPPVGLPLPKSKIFANISYGIGPGTIGLRWRHLPSMRDVTSVTRPANPAPGVPSYDIFDLNAAWEVNEQFGFNLGVTNLFDADPPVVGGTLGQTQPGTYDIIGRSFYAGATIRF
ncbi:TonB-dependent receptor domain-containing protein [Sphingosinicella terrae]|uniref:TonB-dependent receptor domain-containing protein n=1 Tax=Sphingosinicella terrae TaxID=2172047 RepID=UPI0013B3CB25|nr:TonB-dependent receptor [Sphingosinicella terrae]